MSTKHSAVANPRLAAWVSRGAGFRRDDPLVLAFETGLPQKCTTCLPNHAVLYSLEAYPKGERVYAVYKEMQN